MKGGDGGERILWEFPAALGIFTGAELPTKNKKTFNS
jgi:hypothetical protein